MAENDEKGNESNLAHWMGTVDKSLKVIEDSIAQLLSKVDGIFTWQSGIEGRLSELSSASRDHEKRITKLEEWKESRNKEVKDEAVKESRQKYEEFKDFFKTYLTPIIIAFIMWLLFDLFPRVGGSP